MNRTLFKSIRLIIIYSLALFSALGCQRAKPDFEAEKQKLLALHQVQQDAHLQENVQAFVGQFAENMLSVNAGKISINSQEISRKRFQSYFDQVGIKKWEDINPPWIEFSADAPMAYMAQISSAELSR